MIIAVDTGGTKTLVAKMSTDGEIIETKKFPTPPAIDNFIAELKTTIDEILGDETVTSLSVALPGTIKNGVMLWAGNLKWHDINIRALLENHYDCPIIVENDANLAGLAEAHALEIVPKKCLYVTVSTGVGTGIITNGRIDPDFSTNEGGQIILEHDGEFARWESFASGKALHEKYGLLASEITDENLWREIGENIGRGLLATSALLRPDVVVIGGGVGTHFDKFERYLLEMLQRNSESIYIPEIKKAVHPEEAVIYGCFLHAAHQNDL